MGKSFLGVKKRASGIAHHIGGNERQRHDAHSFREDYSQQIASLPK